MKMAAMLGAALLLAQASPAPRIALDRLQQAAQQQGVSEPLDVLLAEKAWAGADVLLPLAASPDSQNQLYAIRALGRLEDPRVVPQLLALGNTPGTPPGAVAAAIAQSLRGFDPLRDPSLIARVSTWLRRVSFVKVGINVTAVPAPIGNIVYGDAEQVHGAEDLLRRILDDSAYDRRKQGTYLAASRSLEALGRLNAKVTFDEETVTRLGRMVVKTLPNDDLDAVRENALAALISARALEADTEKQALKDTDWQVRRLAMTVLGGAGAGIADDERLDLIVNGLSDVSGQVRYEALRGYVRRGAGTRGCGPIVDLLGDQDPHVVLAAVDALGDLCKEDESITTRLTAEARTPPAGAWHREAHAFVALAKRSPDAAAISMEAFATHPTWWVRMYAARAAAALGDLIRLDKLAYDTNDNVREAALGPLHRLKKADADAAIVAALERSDVQLLRTAATLVKESPRNERFGRPLLAALHRLTKEGKETSRDARLPLLDAIAVHAKPGDATELEELLKDFDPQVAARAADVVMRLTGKPVVADPRPPQRSWPPSMPDLRQCVTVSLSSGPSFRLVMNPGAAPMTVDRFLKLAAIDHYYDGLTIHRIAPNFVIQGGGPGANEYAGHKDFMRDEIGAANTRGTVGLSTRGRNTADGQFFINLVDNRRLDGDYTVFASVLPADMPVVDRIQEGDVMRLNMVKCPPK
jgi:cyclophilin family peptidyl-prolyl cis-trans isomerase/HEAT repeat protein